MAIPGPSHYIDLTLKDSFSSIYKNNPTTQEYDEDIIELFSDDEIDESPTSKDKASSSSRPKKDKGSDESDDEILIVERTISTGKGKSSIKASTSKLDISPRGTRILSDELFARLLGREYNGSGSVDSCLDGLNDEFRLPTDQQSEHLKQDELLAHQLAEEYAAELSQLSVSPEDIELARQLAEQEEANYKSLLKTIESKEEGIVFSVVVNAADDTLEDGSPAHPDDLERFRPWKQLFEKSGYTVKKFHWFVNYELEKKFEQARDKLEEITGQVSEELELFHGTSAENIDSILHGGFRIGGVGGHRVINGAALGCGIYLAADAATSINYSMGANKMFACRVIPGRVTNTIMTKPPRSTEPGTERWECYTNDRVYVHRYSSLVLPCYMIEFSHSHQSPYQRYWFNRMGVAANIPLYPAALLSSRIMVQRRGGQGGSTSAFEHPNKRRRSRLEMQDDLPETPKKRQKKTGYPETRSLGKESLIVVKGKGKRCDYFS